MTVDALIELLLSKRANPRQKVELHVPQSHERIKFIDVTSVWVGASGTIYISSEPEKVTA